MASAWRDEDRGFKHLMVNLKRARTEVRIGVSDAPHEGSGGMTIAQIGALHEFGQGHNPERSFLRAWADSDEPSWLGRLKETLFRALLGDGRWVDDFGKYAVEGVRARIRLGIPPPLKHATVKRKKNGSTPLIESEQLLKGIVYEADR